MWFVAFAAFTLACAICFVQAMNPARRYLLWHAYLMLGFAVLAGFHLWP